MPKVQETRIIIPKQKSKSIKVGQTVTYNGKEQTINQIDVTDNAIFVQVDDQWYGAKIFLAKFEVKE